MKFSTHFLLYLFCQFQIARRLTKASAINSVQIDWARSVRALGPDP